MSAWYFDPLNQPIPDDSWLLRRFPELTRFDGRDAREKAFRIAMSATRGWVLLVAMVLVTGAGILTGWVGWYVPLASWDWVWGCVRVCLTLLPMIAAGVLVHWIRRRHIERSLRVQLIERGCPICMECGYDLQGLSEPRCPECGTAFDPKLLKNTNTGATHEY